MTQRPGEYVDESPKLAARLLSELPEEETPPASAAAPAATAVASADSEPQARTPPAPAPAPAPKPKTWEENLADAEITPEQAFEILDTILAQGYYERTFELFQGRWPVTLRTRNNTSRLEIARYIDLEGSLGPRTSYERRMRAVLLYSLVRLGKASLPWPADDASAETREKVLQQREAFIEKIPAVLSEALYEAVRRFETATFAALSGGAPTGF